MGYDTNFKGHWTITPALKPEHLNYLRAFTDTRHRKRVPGPDEGRLRTAVGLPFGEEGLFVVDVDQEGQVVSTNRPPAGAPGFWCEWSPSLDGTTLAWNDQEMFDEYIEWIRFLIRHFYRPWGYKLNGTVEWSGEEQGDAGRIEIKDNVVRVARARLVYDDEEG